jgi:phosphoglycerol geranylgeranyltransferase
MNRKKIDIDDWIYRTKRGLFVLIDPDKGDAHELALSAEKAVNAGADAILVGSSFLIKNDTALTVSEIKKRVKAPVFLFPGNGGQLTGTADGVLFLSLISGRNPRWLIEEQVESAPKIRDLGLSTIPTAYILIESGRRTSVEFVSNTTPIPRHATDVASAHALAAQYLGMRAIYLDAGSGADLPIPKEIISSIRKTVDLPIIVGGGIRDLKTLREISNAGADFIVIGNSYEKNGDTSFIKKAAQIVHSH